MVAQLQPGDVVMLPSMGGALLHGAVSEWLKSHGGELFPLPASRHPYVSLTMDTTEEMETTCKAYADAAHVLMAALPGRARAWAEHGNRVVYLDVNSATGRDAVLLEGWLQHLCGTAPDFFFMVLIEESSTASVVGGHRGQRVRAPDYAAVRLHGGSTRYLSHLIFLARHNEDQRFGISRKV